MFIPFKSFITPSREHPESRKEQCLSLGIKQMSKIKPHPKEYHSYKEYTYSARPKITLTISSFGKIELPKNLLNPRSVLLFFLLRLTTGFPIDAII